MHTSTSFARLMYIIKTHNLRGESVGFQLVLQKRVSDSRVGARPALACPDARGICLTFTYQKCFVIKFRKPMNI